MTRDLPSREEVSVYWPYPLDEFVRASQLVEDGATDKEVREAVEGVEDGVTQ